MTTEEFVKAINAIPGEQGYWKNHSKDVHNRAAHRLVGLGMTHEQAISFLSELYYATAEEFGG
jgi:hypothetical protein